MSTILALPAPRRYWLFSAPVDLGVFLGSAVLSFVALAVGAQLGLLHDATPDWAWVPAVVLIDVAHVWSTAFRVYFDPHELRRRFALYLLVPLIGYALGIALYSEGELLFWRVLAYLAVFHFVRQQYGWVALYRARLGERDRPGWWIDTVTIYLATLYPLLHWHAHLPREFWWFLHGDFQPLPAALAQIAEPVYWSALALYGGRSVWRGLCGFWNPGKDIVVVTTALCWYVGIIACNSDYAFTVTNVIIHGVPYMALVFCYQERVRPAPRTAWWHRLLWFLFVLWLIAFVEEMFWDRAVWHERGWLFGDSWDASEWKLFLVPLLALPQLTHYVLDGFIWKRGSNPEVRRLLE
jgi:hypothetical protein